MSELKKKKRLKKVEYKENEEDHLSLSLIKRKDLITQKSKEIYSFLKENRMAISWELILKDATNFVDTILPEFKHLDCGITVKRLRDNVYNRLNRRKRSRKFQQKLQ